MNSTQARVKLLQRVQTWLEKRLVEYSLSSSQLKQRKLVELELESPKKEKNLERNRSMNLKTLEFKQQPSD